MKTMGLIFANLNEKNVPELTETRSMASVPFAGRYRLIDFALSNLVQANASKVGVVTKYNFQSLMDHLGSGSHWDLARKNGGLVILPPFGDSDRQLYSSRFEAIKSVLPFLKKCDEEILVMFDTDNVCSFDLEEAIDFHARGTSDMTLLYRKDAVKKGKTRTLLTISNTDKVTNITTTNVANGESNIYAEIVITRREFLIRAIEKAVSHGTHSFSGEMLPSLVAAGAVNAFAINGYFASIDSLQSYFKNSMELLDKDNRDELFGAHEVYTKVKDSAPLHMAKGGSAVNSLIADGCVIEGTVENSILFRGVNVGKNAVVKNSVVFQDSVIGEHAHLEFCVCDKSSVIKSGRKLSGCDARPYFIPKDSVL